MARRPTTDLRASLPVRLVAGALVAALAVGCAGTATRDAGTGTPTAGPTTAGPTTAGATAPDPTTLPSPHQDVARTSGAPYGPDVAQVLDTYVPAVDVPSPTGDPDQRPAFVLVHGGAWSAGTRTSNHPIAVELASAGWVAVTVGYRLAPDHTFPAPVEDVDAALRWVHARADRLGVDPDRVVLGGQSAGGHMSGLVALADDRPPVAAWVSWSGAYDLGPLAGRLAETVYDELVGSIAGHLGCEEPAAEACADRATAASPIERVSPDDPPTLLLHSTDEALPLVGAQAMRDALDGAGVRVQLTTVAGSAHGLDLVPATDDDVGAFLAGVLELEPHATR